MSSLVYIHPATHLNPFEDRASQYFQSLNPFWSVLTFLVSFFICFFSPSSTGLRAPGCSVSGFTCSEWEAIRGNLSWVEAEKAYRLFCLWKNRQLWGTCLHPRKPCEGAAKGTCMWTSYGIVLVKLWPCTSLQSPIIYTSVQVGLRIFCWLDTPETGTFCSRKEAFSLFCFIQIGLSYHWLCGFYQWFSYLAVTSFLMLLGVNFFIFSSPHQVRCLHFLTSGLCCSAGLWRRVSLIGQAQSSPIIVLLWLQRKELLVDSVLWSEAVSHTPHSAQWVPALVVEALWLLPWRRALFPPPLVLPAVF